MNLTDVAIPLPRFQGGGQFSTTYKRMMHSRRKASPSKRVRISSDTAPVITMSSDTSDPNPDRGDPDLDPDPSVVEPMLSSSNTSPDRINAK